MTNFYPYTTPIILSDETFSDYGQDATKGTPKTRKLAYRIAEMKVSEDLRTFLTPTIYSGTYTYPYQYPFLLDHAWVNQVYLVRFRDVENVIYFTASGTFNIYTGLQNDERGVLDIHYWFGACNCSHTPYAAPYMTEVVYNAGLPTGTVMQPDIMLGLATYADIILNEIVGWGNEGAGDVGISDFSNQQYREVRRIMNTNFGSSPRAIFAHRMLQRLRRLRYVGM